MATRKGIYISGNYFIYYKLYAFLYTYFAFKKNKSRTESYFILSIAFKTQRPSDTVF